MKNKKTQTKRLYNKKVVEKLHCNMTSGHKSNKIFVINDWSWKASIFIKERRKKGLKNLVKSTTLLIPNHQFWGFLRSIYNAEIMILLLTWEKWDSWIWGVWCRTLLLDLPFESEGENLVHFICYHDPLNIKAKLPAAGNFSLKQRVRTSTLVNFTLKV